MSNTQTAAAGWFKSSYSAPDNECVEVRGTSDVVGVRDSKDLARRPLAVPAGAFAALVAALRNGTL